MSDSRPAPALRRRDIMTLKSLFWLSFSAALFAGFITLMAMGFFENREAAFRGRIAVIALIATVSTFVGTALCIWLLMLMVEPADVAHVVDKPTLIAEDHTITELNAQRAATDAAKAAARARRAQEHQGHADTAPHA